MKLQEINATWTADGKFDDLNIDLEICRISSLHAKYIEWLGIERGTLRALSIQRKRIDRKLRDYYLGISTDDELKEFNRKPYPERILKNEVHTFVSADDLIIDIDSKMAMIEVKIMTLEDIMKQIHQRNYQFTNIITWRKLMLGG